MIRPQDIDKYAKANPARQHAQEKTFQQDALHYLASEGMEAFAVSEQDISQLTQRIDRSTKTGGSGSAVFVSLLCGLLIGLSVFFVLFQKSKIHPSVYMPFSEDANNASPSLHNQVNAGDTLFHYQPAPDKQYTHEHFSSVQNTIETITEAEIPETLETKTVPANITANLPEEDLMLKFVPNAPVVYIHDLKITNYRQYYFKNDQRIDLTGISAQYADKSDQHNILEEKEPVYYAHQQLRDAMRKFSKSNYSGCIHELQDLLELNNSDVNALFYSGMSYYYLNNDTKALEYYNKVLDSDNNIFHQEAAFYKAQGLLRSKQTEEAISLLKRIEAEKGFYSARAHDILNARPQLQ